jgi:hypothetical protein
MLVTAVAIATTASLFAPRAVAEEFSVASYNIENFDTNFSAFHQKQAARKHPIDDPQAKAAQEDAIRAEDEQNQEDQWEISETILDPAFFPDIIMIQEGCLQSDLEYFNKRWLKSSYETVLVLPTNLHPGRPQTLAVMMKPGFKILEKRDQYYLEQDTVPNSRGNRLFARGPSFLKVQTPGGYVFWVGNTHQKSKGVRLPPADAPAATQPVADEADTQPTDTDPAPRDDAESRQELRARMEQEANAWRIRESVRTHQILKEIQATGPTDVMLVGDMNDDVGLDKNEQILGKDGIMELVGPPEDKFHLATQPLVEAKINSYGGYWRPRYRSLIDHAVISDSMKENVTSVSIFKGSLSAVASDHFPLLIKVKSDDTPPTPAAAAGR